MWLRTIRLIVVVIVDKTQNFGNLATYSTLMLKTIGSSRMPAPKTIGAGNSEIIVSNTQSINSIS